MKDTIYRRNISSKEAQEGFIFILKNKLSLFPTLGSVFTITQNKTSVDVKVESYPCTCRGPDKPHEHYYICWEGLNAGDRIEIVKKGDKYILYINPL
jgi:hypothetical protein